MRKDKLFALTRKHRKQVEQEQTEHVACKDCYVAIARVLKESIGAIPRSDVASIREVQVGLVADRIADYMAADNPAFDRARFLKACGVAS